VLGKTVKEIPLENREGQAIIHVNDLHSGLYFYTVIADGRSSTPGKLIIHDH
jgi:hypothetical protein